ncbi:MAG TPA: hypothetical protein VFZ67_06575 [Nitrososphaera sp.]
MPPKTCRKIDASRPGKLRSWRDCSLKKYLAKGNKATDDRGLKTLDCRLVSENTFTQEHGIINMKITATKKQERVENKE